MSDINTSSIAFELVNKYLIKTPFSTGVPYIYNNGYYTCSDSIRKIKSYIIKDLHNDDLSSIKLNEIYQKVIGLSSDDYETAENNYILLNNGLLNLDTLELEKVDPDIFVTWYMDVTYDLSIASSKFNNFVAQLVSNSDVPKLQEHFGNIFANHYETKKLLYAVGPENSGKSTLFNIVQKLLGIDNYSNLSLIDLGDRFRSSGIYGKKVNICSDVEYKYGIQFVGRIKSLTGGDTITVEFKHQTPFSYKPIAKQFFSGNGIPTINNGSGDNAFFYRWDFVEFPHQFKPNNSIIDTYTTPIMKTSMFNWMLEGFKRLRENKWNITNALTTRQVEQIFLEARYEVDTFVRWLDNCCEIDTEHFELLEDLFRQCKEWHINKGLSSYPSNVDNFSKKLNSPTIQQLIKTTEFRPSINGRQKPAFRGVRFVK